MNFSTTTAGAAGAARFLLFGCLVLRSVVVATEHSSLRGGGGSRRRAAGMTDDWDAKCPREAESIRGCLMYNRYAGDFLVEICKSCVKMAGSMSSIKTALEGCVDDPNICNGCMDDVVDYFNCGTAIAATAANNDGGWTMTTTSGQQQQQQQQ
eukprot:CAMPEP_0197191490 /NCGR_PEP_ID=MMETSP1423-20130617/23513_1 /TAXON_ID=476441 /ORGANISM="Pseudo-nitzschia heimii, Strain UNC1101" /LENGTH=152 /DNA_ID=CAMNT_0042644143 /DNA_START=52 /DNA_END=507 /DNA_ORIENTATION=-